jgi:hypothetical protein
MAELQEEEQDKIRERAEQLAQEQAELEAARLAAEARAAAATCDVPAPSQPAVGSRAAAEAAPPARRAIPRAAFVDDEEEEAQPTRKLVVLQYSEAEQQATQAGPEPPKAQAAPGQPALDAAALKKQLMASIPKTQEAVFAYPMKWAQVERAPQEVMERISGAQRCRPAQFICPRLRRCHSILTDVIRCLSAGWVSKKIKELMGEDDASFCAYIMSQVGSNAIRTLAARICCMEQGCCMRR